MCRREAAAARSQHSLLERKYAMAGMLSQFSDVRLAELYRFTTFEVLCAARDETAAPPTSPLRVLRLFRSPYLLIEAVTDFNRRHAAACVEKRRTIPTAECGDPWDSASERRLDAEVLAAMRSITRLVVERWNVIPRKAAILADIASFELRQWIREEYEIGRDAHCAAIASLHGMQTATGHTPSAQAADLSSSIPASTTVPRTNKKQSRGPTASEILHSWYSDPQKRPQLLSAGSAEGIGRLIGKSKSQVIGAGPVWDDKIKPALAGQRAYARMERSNGRHRH
jgi:hypothetical protein